MCIGVIPQSIRSEAKFSILIHQKPTPLSLQEQIANDVNIKSCEAHFLGNEY